MLRKSKVFLIFAIFAVLLFSCSKKRKADNSAGKITVMTAIAPQKYLVEKIGSGYVAVEVMVPKGSDPHDFAPTPTLIMQLSKAKIFFRVGMPFEDRIIEKIRGSGLKTLIVDSSEGIVRRKISQDEEEHGNLDHGDDNHDNLDPHVWNSVQNLRIMASNICAALCKESPQHAQEFKGNLSNLDSELAGIQKEISTLMAPFKGRTFYVFHPSFGYFADSCGLKQKAIEAEGKTPTPKQLSEIIKLAIKENVTIIFASPQFSTKSAEAVASAIKGAVVKIDPLPANPVANFRAMASEIKKSFASEKTKTQDAARER
ncbi:MAG: hypothetical protein A2020_02840 [Lentisphaerae bacterium GWF2_45_14]|nr:MAG: hypothetical protein A2020_02840 [Lentisphaerae bacterium GWF2_45_14]